MIHTATTKWTVPLVGRTYGYGACDCGWEGPSRNREQDVLDDWQEHLDMSGGEVGSMYVSPPMTAESEAG